MNPVGVVAEDDQHLGGRVGADTEALQERGRRLGREAGEVLVVRRDFLSQGKPAGASAINCCYPVLISF